jgi:hypothetical protein
MIVILTVSLVRFGRLIHLSSREGKLRVQLAGCSLARLRGKE